ncbi:hypothetical protein E2C01_005525 [Portunus trituberculatus]|uniref:Uncharacterized protein n=1 Tax=Portunus trituberculatus TaxID=210409 RepID=A0A5B7CUF6_PORTR|nr:hypothetical protein [Portunus trituberculatus]
MTNPSKCQQITQGYHKTPDFFFGTKNLVVINASKTQFLHLSTCHNFPDNYPLFFNDTQLSPASTLNINSLFFTHNLNWKLHISSLAKTASMNLGVLRHLCQFSHPSNFWLCTRALSILV